MKRKITLEGLSAFLKKNMATKKDLEQLAISTAKSFEQTATKNDLVDMEARLTQKIEGLGSRTDRCEDNIRVIKTHLKIS